MIIRAPLITDLGVTYVFFSLKYCSGAAIPNLVRRAFPALGTRLPHTHIGKQKKSKN